MDLPLSQLPYDGTVTPNWRRPSAEQRRAEMARRKAELLAESAKGAEDWLTHCDVWQRVEQATSAFAEILRHFSMPIDGETDRTPLLVAVRLARAAEVSRAWRSASASDLVWRQGAKAALRQRFPLLIAMKIRPECVASWKDLCVQYIVATADRRASAHNAPALSKSVRANYLVALTVEQQRREPPAASEPTLLLSALLDISEPHLSDSSADPDRLGRDRLAAADCPTDAPQPVFSWSDLNDHDFMNERSTAAHWQARDPIAMASLRVSVVLVRKRDGRLCSLATTSFVATDNAADLNNRTKVAAAGVIKTRIRCAGPFALPPMLEGRQQPTQPPAPWIGALGSTMRVNLFPSELCTCRPEDFDLDDSTNRQMDVMCLCGCAPRWSLEGIEVFLDRDQDDRRHELSMQALELAEQNEHGRPMLFTVDDVLRVLESPTSAHRWV